METENINDILLNPDLYILFFNGLNDQMKQFIDGSEDNFQSIAAKVNFLTMIKKKLEQNEQSIKLLPSDKNLAFILQNYYMQENSNLVQIVDKFEKF